jgi:hypothetical protein
VASIGRLRKVGAAVVLAAASGGITVAATPPAFAAAHVCQNNSGYTLGTDPAEITAHWYHFCDPGGNSPEDVSISKDVNGTWVEVAEGSGTATYVCQGTAETQYSVQVYGSYGFFDDCG